LLFALVLTGCGLNVEVDHLEAESAPKPLADRGPAPGTYRQSWQVTAATGKEPANYRLVAGNLVVVTRSGLFAYDARTGKPTWHYREPGRELWSIAESDGVIVLGSYRGEDVRNEDEHVVGLDAGTGEQLWETTEEWELLAGGSPGSPTPPEWGDAAAGVVVVEPKFPRQRAGVEARTGKTLWKISSKDVAEKCTDKTGTAGTGAIVLIRMSCSVPERVMVALDARSGELRWRRSLPSLGDPTVRPTIRDGVTLWDETGAPPVLIGADGKELFTGPAGSSCSCDLLVTGGRALLTHRQDKREALVSVDVRTGKATPVPGWTSVLGDVRSEAGGQMYEIRPTVSQGHASSLLPAGLTVTDAASGRLRWLPLPFASPSFTREEGYTLPSTWLGVAGDRLFLAIQTLRPGTAEPGAAPVITSYALAGTEQPVELGGVPASDWPDPCRLLTGLPPETETSGRREPGEGTTIGQVRIPRLTCTAFAKDGYDSIGVQVLWVSRTEGEAAGLMKGVRAVIAGNAKVVRVGRVIVAVRAGDSPAKRALAEQTVVRNLRALG
jgi:outer membrane protein assembly factor BamB